MNQGEQNPEKVFKFNNNKHRLEDESIKPEDLKMKFSLNPLEKLQSTKTVYEERKIKSEEIGEFDGLHDSDLYNTRDLEKQKSIQFVIDSDEKPKLDEKSYELQAG